MRESLLLQTSSLTISFAAVSFSKPELHQQSSGKSLGCCMITAAPYIVVDLRMQIRAAVPMYLLSRKIKALGFKVVMSGEGADEIFGGYLYFHKAPSPAEFHRYTPVTHLLHTSYTFVTHVFTYLLPVYQLSLSFAVPCGCWLVLVVSSCMENGPKRCQLCFTYGCKCHLSCEEWHHHAWNHIAVI